MSTKDTTSEPSVDVAPIFVSYARDNASTVLPIVNQLRNDGFALWIDLEGIEGASFWRKEIVDAIEAAPAILFFASHASCKSDNISKELALASEERKSILPVFLDSSKPPAELRYQLAGLQRINWDEKSDIAYKQMVLALSRLLQRPPPPNSNESSLNVKSHGLSRRQLIVGIASAATVSGIVGFYYLPRRHQETEVPNATGERESIVRTGAGSQNNPLAASAPSDRKALRLRGLVIGNQNYASTARLVNPIADAKRVSDTLKDQNFQVTEVFDATYAELREKAKGFYQKEANTRGIVIDNSRPAAVTTIYFLFYSGHAITYDKEPCVIAVDVNPTNEASIRRYIVPFRELLGSNFGVVPRNQLTLYSTSPGQEAQDGEGGNSPFTESLFRHMQNPALDVASMFAYVTRDVRRATQDRQVPWVEGSLDAPLFLGNLSQSNVEGDTLISVLDACRNSPFSSEKR